MYNKLTCFSYTVDYKLYKLIFLKKFEFNILLSLVFLIKLNIFTL